MFFFKKKQKTEVTVPPLYFLIESFQFLTNKQLSKTFSNSELTKKKNVWCEIYFTTDADSPRLGFNILSTTKDHLRTADSPQ